MSTYYLPFRGDIVDIAAQGRYLILAVQHAEGQPLPAVRINAEELLVMGAQMDALKTVGPNEDVRSVCAVDGQSFYGTQDGALYREAPEQPLAAIGSFDGPIKGLYPLANGQLLVRFSDQAVIVSQADGTAAQQLNFDGDDITAVAVQPGGERFALGFAGGGILLFYVKDGQHKEAYLLDENDEILEVAHERGVTGLLFTTDEDAQSQLISLGADLRMLQTPIEESRPMPREVKGLHSMPVRTLVNGPHGRFHTLGQDKTVKTWTGNYSRIRPATTQLDDVPQNGVLADLPVRDSSGRWSNRPHLVVTSGAVIHTLPIEDLDAGGEAVDPDELKNNGLIKGTGPVIRGGTEFMTTLGASKDDQLRKQVLDIVSTWKDTPAVEFLSSRANVDETVSLRQRALQALFGAEHPRTVVLLEGLLTSKHTETRELAYANLRKAVGEAALRPMQLGLQNSEAAIASRAATDLGGLARAGDVAALDLLKQTLSHSMPDVAAAAYDQLAGVGDTPPALPGVEGVLIGIRSNQGDVRRRAIARLKERGLINTLPAQVVLRRMRDDDDEAMRERAFYVSLLGQPRLAELMRSDDDELHRQLCDLELLGASTEERLKAIENPPTGQDVTLTEDDQALLYEMSASQSADISAMAAVTHTRLGDRGSLPILLQLCRESSTRLRRRACRGLLYMRDDSMAIQELESLMLSDDDTTIRMMAYNGVLQTTLEQGTQLSTITKALDSSHGDLRKTAVVHLQRYINTLLAQELVLTYGAKSAAAEELTEEVALLQRALDDSTFEAHINAEAYKTFFTHKLIGGTLAATMAHLVGNANKPVRDAAVKDILTKLDEEWAVDLMIQCLGDSSSRYRNEIFDQAFERVKGTPMESVMLDGALKSSHRDIRRKAFRNIIATTGAWQTPFLRSALGDDDREIRGLAISEQVVKALNASGKASAHLEEALNKNDSTMQQQAIVIANRNPDLINDAIYACLMGFVTGSNRRLAVAAFGNGLRNWAKDNGQEQDLITQGFGSSVVDIRRTILGWLRGMDSDWAEALLQNGLSDSDRHISQTCFNELLQRQQSAGNAESFLRSTFQSGSSTLQNNVFTELRKGEAGWVEGFLFEVLVGDDDKTAQTAFEILLERHKARGEEEAFVSRAMQINEKFRRKAFGLVQSTSSSWKLKMLQDALDSEDNYIRSMAIEELITHELDDDTLIGLLKHSKKDVQSSAMAVLARKGRVDVIRSEMSRALRQPKPQKWAWEDSSRHSKRVTQWRDTKVTILNVAGEAQDTSLFDDVMYVVDQSRGGGRERKRGSASARWDEPSLRKLAILQLGWICPEDKIDALKLLFNRERDRDCRYNAALALANTGDYDGAKWLYDQGASSAHIIQALIAVGDDGEALMQRLMKEKPALCDEALFAWMLRLVAVGGAVECLSLGLTSSQADTRLNAGRLLGVCDDRDRLLDRLVQMLSDRDPFADDPFAKAGVGADWYRISKLLYEFYAKDYPVESEIPRTDWRRLGLLFAHDSAAVRARAVTLLYKLRVHGMKQHEFQTILRQRADRHLKTLDAQPAPLTLNGEPVSAELAMQLSMGAFTGLMRQAGNPTHRRKALRGLVDLAVGANVPRRAVPVLQTCMAGRVATLRRDAFGLLVRLSLEAQERLNALREDDENSEESTEAAAPLVGISMSVLDLAEAAIHTADSALQQQAISLLWLTGERTRIEELLRSRDDETALYAFQILMENRKEQRLEILPMALASGNTDIRKDAVKKLVAELQRRRTEKEDDKPVLSLVEQTLQSPYPEVVRQLAILAAHAQEPAGKSYLTELLNSHITADQKAAVKALVALKAPGTALLFLDRADLDQTGSVDRNVLFDGVLQLKDRSDAVLDRLFELVGQGTDDPEYTHAIKTLLALSGHNNRVKERSVWDQLSENDQQKQQETYDDGLLARLMEALYQHGHHSTLLQYSLIDAAKTAWSNDAEASLKAWLTIPNTPQNKDIKLRSLSAVAWRYNNRGASDTMSAGLIEALDWFDANKEISQFQYVAATTLGDAGFKGDSRVFTFLRRIAVNAEQSEVWRKKAVTTLGQLADLRAVESLLNVAGYDEQGQPLPEELTVDQNTRLQLAAIEALGQMSSSPLAGAFFQVLSDGSRKHDRSFVVASVKGLAFFGNHPTYAGPALERLQGVQESRFWGMTQQVITAIGELWKRCEDDAVRGLAVDALIERLNGSNRRDVDAAYKELKGMSLEDDLRPQVALLRNSVRSSHTNAAVETLSEKWDGNTLFAEIRSGRDNGMDSSRVKTLVQGLLNRRPCPVDAALASFALDIKRDTTVMVEEALTVLRNGSDLLDDTAQQTIVAHTAAIRTAWGNANALLAKGQRDQAEKVTTLGNIWEQLLDLCGSLSVGLEEFAAALQTAGVSLALQRRCLLALETAGSTPMDAVEGLYTTGQRQLRPLIAATLSTSDSRTALLPNAKAELSSMYLLVGDGGKKTTKALRGLAEGGETLALQSLSRLGDVASLVAVLDAATKNATADDPISAEENRVVNVLHALGTTGDETAEARLAQVGQSDAFDPALRRLAWTIRRRSQRIRARRTKYSAETAQ